MDKHELELRTKKFAVDVIRFVASFDRTAVGRVIANQLLKSATSVGANYREANRSVSRREFTHKITLVEKEASETEYWLEICIDSRTGSPESATSLLGECRELVAIFTSIGRSMRAHDRSAKAQKNSVVSEPATSEYTDGRVAADDDAVDALVPAFSDD